jgi:phage terminase large subunit
MPAFLDRVPESRRFPIIADSADPRMISAMVKAGFRVQKATKGPGSIDSGISFLQGRDIVINPRCKNAIREAGAWSWKLDKQTGKPIVGTPADGDDHCWDAARYATESLMRAPLRVRVRTEDPPQPLIRPRPQ